MGRKHKNTSVKYKIENLTKQNKTLTETNVSLLSRNIISEKKLSEMETFQCGMLEIINRQKAANNYQQQKIDILETQISLLSNNQEINPFTRSLALACSVKLRKEKEEEEEEGEGDKFKIID